MKRLLIHVLNAIALLISISTVVLGQNATNSAIDKANGAVKLMDKGHYDESIHLLEEALALDAQNISIHYELAYAYYLKEDYQKVINILDSIIDHPDVNDRYFQQLGNAYDLNNHPDKAIETYKKGLKKFPQSGPLHLELGNIYLQKEAYAEALNYYENGIAAAPAFPSNYFWAAILYLSTTEKVWGMIYGEIFMNLERKGKRTEQISELLYKTYTENIVKTSDTTLRVTFSQYNTIDASKVINKEKFELPFGIGVYERLLMMSAFDQSQINLSSLPTIRSRFIDLYYEEGLQKTYPNVLFDYQKKIQDAGHAESYHYWILMKGHNQSFIDWHAKHNVEWENFVNWFIKNPIEVDKNNVFLSSNYE